jgi:hypothetical protein
MHESRSIQRSRLVAFTLLALFASRQAAAQKFGGIGAGLVVPAGQMGRIDNVGYGIVGVWQSILPLRSAGIRLDAAFSAMSRKATVQDITERITDLSAGAVIRFPRVSVAYGYAIAAAGVYNHSTSPAPVGSTSSTDLGVSFGAGWRFSVGGRKAFAEARYHKIMSSGGPRFLPVNLGLAF